MDGYSAHQKAGWGTRVEKAPEYVKNPCGLEHKNNMRYIHRIQYDTRTAG
jgi:hypothetical protein